MTVSYELTSFLTAIRKTDSVNNVVETSFKKVEEVFTCNRIIRPAYKTVQPKQTYVSLEER